MVSDEGEGLARLLDLLGEAYRRAADAELAAGAPPLDAARAQAYARGELPEAEQAAIEGLLARSPGAAEQVAEAIRALAARPHPARFLAGRLGLLSAAETARLEQTAAGDAEAQAWLSSGLLRHLEALGERGAVDGWLERLRQGAAQLLTPVTLAYETGFTDRPPRPLRYVSNLRNGGRMVLSQNAEGQLVIEVLLHEPAPAVTVVLFGESVANVVSVEVPLEADGERARGVVAVGPVGEVLAQLGNVARIEPLVFYPPEA